MPVATPSSPRLASIDIFRALTMLLMIWVNDFHTLTGVPKWLEHAKYGEDYLGFSDIIFPLFLFLVGMSIPLAIDKRRSKGEKAAQIARHILIRSGALLLIGVYMVNYETAYDAGIPIGKYGWCLVMAIAVILIWMDWGRSPLPAASHRLFRGLGILLLIGLAAIYVGGPEGQYGMRPQWWGILGLIGWAYLANALLYLWGKGRIWLVASSFGLFLALSVLSALDHLPALPGFLSYLSTLYGGTVPAFTAMGVLATLLFRRWRGNGLMRLLGGFLGMGLICLVAGLWTRPLWGISKLGGTPSWLLVCLAIGLIVFVLLYILVDVRGQKAWANLVMPAGTATLTCYLLPYLFYPLKVMTGIHLPAWLNHGLIGLGSSMAFALLVVLLTGFFEKKGFKLKL